MPFTWCISRKSNTEIDDAQYIDVVIPLYNLGKHSDNYSKKSGILFQYCRDVPVVDNDYWLLQLLTSLKIMLLIGLILKKN